MYGVRRKVSRWRPEKALLAAAHDFSPRYRLLLKAGYGSLLRERVRDAPCMPCTGHALADRYLASFWAGAICSVIEDWVRADEDMPASELAGLGTMLMQRGISASGNPR